MPALISTARHLWRRSPSPGTFPLGTRPAQVLSTAREPPVLPHSHARAAAIPSRPAPSRAAMTHAAAPEAMAGVIAFLVSDAAAPVSGAIPPADDAGRTWRTYCAGRTEASSRMACACPWSVTLTQPGESPGSGDGLSPGWRQAWARRESSTRRWRRWPGRWHSRVRRCPAAASKAREPCEIGFAAVAAAYVRRRRCPGRAAPRHRAPRVRRPGSPAGERRSQSRG